MHQLLKLIGNPQKHFQSIHIAGTKGKGSVAITTEKILRISGYKTGLFTSPHIITMLERIQINGSNITHADFVFAMNKLYPFLQIVKPTYFEILTVISFLIFAKSKVDFAIIEVGLGGRLDSTNVINPIITVITTIDYDHTNILGKHLSQITNEKAGIIKPQVPVVVSPQRKSVLEIIKKIAKLNNSEIIIATSLQNNLPGILNPPKQFLMGHRLTNLITTLTILETLNKMGKTNINNNIVNKALKSLSIQGRFEIISTKPRIIVDVAHNPVSISALVETIKHIRYNHLVLIFGALADKDIYNMLKIILPMSDKIIFTKPTNPRAAGTDKLLQIARRLDKFTLPIITNSVVRALDIAKIIAKNNDIILVTGSFSLVGELLWKLNPRGSAKTPSKKIAIQTG